MRRYTRRVRPPDSLNDFECETNFHSKNTMVVFAVLSRKLRSEPERPHSLRTIAPRKIFKPVRMRALNLTTHSIPSLTSSDAQGGASKEENSSSEGPNGVVPQLETRIQSRALIHRS